LTEQREDSELGDLLFFIIPMATYLIIVLAVTLGFDSEYQYQFHYYAIVLGVIGAYVIKEKNKIKISNYWILLPILVALLLRITPYLDNSIPLGYDPGIYKYIIERYWEGLPSIIPGDLEKWIVWNPPGLFILTTLLHIFGFSTFDQYLILFIFFDILIILGIYAVVRRYFSTEAALIASFFYAVSFVQFKAYSAFFYKNILAIFLALIFLYLLRSENRKNYIPLILIGAFLGAVHRPTFLLIGLVYLFSFIERRDIRYKFLAGAAILLLAVAVYVPEHLQSLNLLQKVVSLNVQEGKFYSVEDYHYSSMFYLPLSVAGGLIALRKRNLNPVLYWAFIVALIVYLNIMWQNRFTIHLDIGLILLSGVGFYYLLKYNRVFGLITLLLLSSTSLYSAYEDANAVSPRITKPEFEYIASMQDIEEDAYAMTVSSFYAPWVGGFSGMETIGPGIFHVNKWDRAEWVKFWLLKDSETAAEMLKDYDKPIYIYIGRLDFTNENKFNGDCFELVSQEAGAKIYRFDCGD